MPRPAAPAAVSEVCSTKVDDSAWFTCVLPSSILAIVQRRNLYIFNISVLKTSSLGFSQSALFETFGALFRLVIFNKLVVAGAVLQIPLKLRGTGGESAFFRTRRLDLKGFSS